MLQVFAEVAAALRGQPAPPPATLQTAVSELMWHARELAEWEQDEHAAIRQMRKFVSLYCHGFSSALKLQERLMRARTCRDYQDAVAVSDWDPQEVPCDNSYRHPRLKSGAHGSVQRVKLPENWLDDVWSYEAEALYDEACEG